MAFASRASPLSGRSLRAAAGLRVAAPKHEELAIGLDELLTELGKDPRVLRRKILTGTGVAAAMIGTVFTVHWLRRQPRVCTESAEQLAVVWNDERKATVSSGLSAVQGAFVPATVGLVETSLDEYGRSWVQMHTEACEATHLRGEQSAELLDLRTACLQDRLRRFEALAQVLIEADTKTMSRAAKAAASLAPLAACADAERLRSRTPPPGWR